MPDASDGATQQQKIDVEERRPHERSSKRFAGMLLARTLEEKLVSLYRARPDHGRRLRRPRPRKRSALPADCSAKGRHLRALIRDKRAVAFAAACRCARTHLVRGRAQSRGRDGNISGRPRDGQFAMQSSWRDDLGRVGALMAKRFKGEKNLSADLHCEGGMQTGSAHEGLNIAAWSRCHCRRATNIIMRIPRRTSANLPATIWWIARRVRL